MFLQVSGEVAARAVGARAALEGAVESLHLRHVGAGVARGQGHGGVAGVGGHLLQARMDLDVHLVWLNSVVNVPGKRR